MVEEKFEVKLPKKRVEELKASTKLLEAVFVRFMIISNGR